MKKAIFLAILGALILSGCGSKTIERTSPCVCYDVKTQIKVI